MSTSLGEEPSTSTVNGFLTEQLVTLFNVALQQYSQAAPGSKLLKLKDTAGVKSLEPVSDAACERLNKLAASVLSAADGNGTLDGTTTAPHTSSTAETYADQKHAKLAERWAKWIDQLLGPDGQQNFRDCMRAKHKISSSLGGFEVMINDIPAAPSSLTACSKAIIAVNKFVDDSEDDIVDNLEALPSKKRLIEATHLANSKIQSSKHSFLLETSSKLALAEQWVGIRKEWSDPESQAWQELEDYSARKGRFISTGYSPASLGFAWLLEQSKEDWKDLTPEDQKKFKARWRSCCSVGRSLAAVRRAWGCGFIVLMNRPMVTALRSNFRNEELQTSIEESKAEYPGLQEIFDFVEAAILGIIDTIPEPTQPLAKLFRDIARDPGMSFTSISSSEVLRSAAGQNHDGESET